MIRNGCLTGFVLIAVLIAVPVVWRGAVKLYYGHRMFPAADVPPREAAIVFGAAVYGGGRLSPVLRDRVETAIALYMDGRVNTIIVSGDNRSPDYDEPGAMKAYAIDRGVPEDAIIVDRAGHRTYDTCYRARHVFTVGTAVLVTQAFHLPRALLTCEGLGIDAVGSIADRRPYRGAGWYEFRETAATLVAAWDVLRREPPPIIQSADEGNRSWPIQAVSDN